MEKNNKFVITNNKGEELECDILFTFDDDKLKKSYIVYTDNTKDSDGQIKVYANTFDPTGADATLGKIETEEEWNNIQNILASLNEKIGESNGEK